ncbi:MAG: polyprenyl synthetase family protein [Chloroflexi bacterium]|nr:polyprenyl synthetase family protein [Chloroflexota bacterium]
MLPREEGPLAPAILDRYRVLLEPALRRSLAQGEPGLVEMLRYHMGWVDPQGRPGTSSQGKALRPALCLFACAAVGGRAEAALPAAVALELVHNFSLIHDDIQDGDRERRHRPTVWSLWGQPRALVAGNAMRALADQTLLGLQWSGFAAERILQASAILTQCYLEMIEGQYLDLRFEGRLDITPGDYLGMVSKKTGALMEAATHLGALLGTEEEERVEALRRCGRLLGLAFQVRDDVLGIWGDEAVTGKATGADIRRKKKSFPIVYALRQARGSQHEQLTRIYARKELGGHEVAEVLGILEDLGARTVAQRLAEEKNDAALAWARQASLPPWAQQELEELADFVIRRQR